ncbi:hypothetical protein ELX58_03495 [Acetilactobacillus jinshanensis]|uniref:PLD phosphodiesterase domain-containing protein n=2 Tax=Acetilactobacillus jinshanensis TaxID=1720083 RepID=A0A4P6ZL09_9LACO|nr:hypothetical protein ELX58_03495 [Acetilactobacillus jinshanensis]
MKKGKEIPMEKSKQMDLFNNRKPHKYDPLYIIQDGEKVHLSASQIFDSDKYDQFLGVTYAVLSKFINQYITKFNDIKLVIGNDGSKNDNKVYQSFSSVNQNVFNSLKNVLRHRMTDLYQDLNDYAKKLLTAKNFELYTPLTAVIHSKFYLMNNSKTGDNRIVVGSANLSDRAFNPKIKQFENIIIENNSSLFNDYKVYFDQELLPNTQPYFPKELTSLTKKKLVKKDKNGNKQQIEDASVLTPEEVKQAEKAKYVEMANELKHKLSLGLIVPKDLNELKMMRQKLQAMDKMDKKNEDTKNITLKLETEMINPRTKVPKIKDSRSLKVAYKKNVHVEVAKDVGKNVAQRSAKLFSFPSQRVKNHSGLFIEQDNHKLIPFGATASVEQIRHDLNGIQDLMDDYNRFAVDSDNRYCSRIMEIILYAFESPFLYEVRQKAKPQIEGQDIPQFLFIGGQGGSGKSSLLRILIKLLGINNGSDPQLYSEIIPEGVTRKKSLTIKQIEAWINTGNVAPIIVDEVPSVFFKRPNYGNDLIVDETNRCNDTGLPFPVFIGTTNSSDYTLPGRSRRRSYYLENDKVFDTKYRQQSGLAYSKVLDELDSNLFDDFVVRFSNLLYQEPDNFWKKYNNQNTTSNGLYDFLRGARLIFEHYYKICGLPLPKYFPKQRYNDEQESGRDKWKKLYESHPDWFITNPDNHKNMFFDINRLNVNSGIRYGVKPSEVYRNDLSPKVVVGNKNSMQIEIKKEPFFEWIGINPNRLKGWWHRIFK